MPSLGLQEKQSRKRNGTVVLVESGESEEDERIWITVDEVARGSSQPQVALREGEDAGRKRKRQDEEEVQMEPMFGRWEHGGDKIKN